MDTDQTDQTGTAASASLAVRHRPHRFADLVGQRHVAAVLREAVRSDAPPQQVLLSGGSGLGKTTAARIFAAALLCELPADGDACGTCASCTDVAAGVHPDVIEMDAASNGGKDEVNDLAGRARTMPMRGRWKVYIVDEAHGLSRAGGEAFLKLLEEPPPHVVFLLATTDPDKMLATNRGRCLELELTPPSPADVADHLVALASEEGWTLTPAAAEAVVGRADPRLGVRGAVMALSKLHGPLSRGDDLDDELLARYLGWLPHQRVAHLVTLVESHDVAAALDEASALFRSHGDQALRQALVEWARNGLRDGTERSVWRLETIAATPSGPLWTEALVARLASPTLDGTPAAVAALVEEAREAVTNLEDALARTPRLPAAPAPAPAATPTPAPAATPQEGTVPTATAAPTPAAPTPAPAAPPTTDGYDGPPPEYDAPPPEYYDDGYDAPPPQGDRRRTGRSRPKGGRQPARSPQPAAPAAPPVAPPVAPPPAPRPAAAPAARDPWLDDPGSFDTRPAPAAGAAAPAAPTGAPVRKGPPSTAEQVRAAVAAAHPHSAALLSACQVVLRDGAVYVVVPVHLAEQVRTSTLREDVTSAAAPATVNFRVRR